MCPLLDQTKIDAHKPCILFRYILLPFALYAFAQKLSYFCVYFDVGWKKKPYKIVVFVWSCAHHMDVWVLSFDMRYVYDLFCMAFREEIELVIEWDVNKP